jgi:hypothetical protein
MKRYNKRWAGVHKHKGMKAMLVKITTGSNWGGDPELRGTTHLVLVEDGRWYDDDGGFYVQGDRSWVLVEETK